MPNHHNKGEDWMPPTLKRLKGKRSTVKSQINSIERISEHEIPAEPTGVRNRIKERNYFEH
mgnify:CR=1 FL=1